MKRPLNETEITEVYVGIRDEMERAINRRVRDREQAADLAQDLFFRLHRLANRLPNAAEARLYLMRMAHNIGKDHVKIRQNRARLLEGLVTLYDTQPDNQEDVLQQRQKLAQVEAALGELTERQRDMVRRSRILGEDHKTIAAAWNVSRSTVEQEITRAMRLARARVQGM